MKFSIELDDEQSLTHIEELVADELARRIESKVNTKDIRQKAIDEFEKKKNESLNETKLELKRWDKSSILIEMKNMFDKSWVAEVSDKVVEKLKYNSEFIAAVSTAIIKSKFKD